MAIGGGFDSSNISSSLAAVIAMQDERRSAQNRQAAGFLDTKTGKIAYTGGQDNSQTAAFSSDLLRQFREKNSAALIKGREQGLSMTGAQPTGNPKLGSTLLTDPSILNVAPTPPAGKTLLGM